MYVYSCPHCGPFEIFAHMSDSTSYRLCPKCGEDCGRDFGREGAYTPNFHPYWTEALTSGPDPVEVKSKAHEAALCRKVGVERVS